MNKVNQKTAVINTLLSILNERGVDYELFGKVRMSDVLTPDDRATAREMLFTAFRAGEVIYKPTFEAKVKNDKELKSYISSLVNNWVRKAKDLNCDEKHQAKNPGSRAGNADPEVKEMRKLLSITADAEAKAAIQAVIDAKVAAIKAEKNEVEIDYGLINPELLKNLGL